MCSDWCHRLTIVLRHNHYVLWLVSSSDNCSTSQSLCALIGGIVRQSSHSGPTVVWRCTQQYHYHYHVPLLVVFLKCIHNVFLSFWNPNFPYLQFVICKINTYKRKFGKWSDIVSMPCGCIQCTHGLKNGLYVPPSTEPPFKPVEPTPDGDRVGVWDGPCWRHSVSQPGPWGCCLTTGASVLQQQQRNTPFGGFKVAWLDDVVGF